MGIKKDTKAFEYIEKINTIHEILIKKYNSLEEVEAEVIAKPTDEDRLMELNELADQYSTISRLMAEVEYAAAKVLAYLKSENDGPLPIEEFKEYEIITLTLDELKEKYDLK